ncbi:HlyD family efflux transporter periplasmic adaptor subunit [Halomonas saccharevitans]|nr:HlyD family secretion protein [Halomonas saccharevitans]
MEAPVDAGVIKRGSLLVAAGSAELTIPVEARCLRQHFDESRGQYLVAFVITRLDPAQRELLRRVIRAYLAGRHASVEELIDAEDPQTPRRSMPEGASMPASGSLWRYSLLLLASLALLLVLAVTLYRNLLLVEPDFAAVTAPRVDIVAPGNGVLADHGLTPGDRVERDQLLVNIDNRELRAELALAQAGERFNQRLIDTLKTRLADPDTQRVSLFNATRPDDYRATTFETADAGIARERVDQLEASVDFERARVNALETRLSGHRLFSPCECLVAWAVDGAGDVYVQQGDPLMTLTRTEPEAVLVEALVHMEDISRLEPHQLAFVDLGNGKEVIEARVRSIALDIERQPRAGFPHWVRQQQNVASVLLVPERPLPPHLVGRPVEVRFSDAPAFDAVAEWFLSAFNGLIGRFVSTSEGEPS